MNPLFTLESQNGSAIFRSRDRLLRIGFPSPSIARVTFTQGRPFLDKPSHIVVAESEKASYELCDDADSCTLRTSALTVVLNKPTGALSYFDSKGKLLVREPERGGKWLKPRQVTRNIFNQQAAVADDQNIDGARASATSHTAVFDRDAFEAKLEFVFEDEALFGLGSHEEGYGNLRDRSRELYQQNMKAVVPHLVSTRGYGVLLDCCSLMTFHDDVLGSYWWAEVVDELDYYIIQGSRFEEVIRGYYYLTVPPPLLPKWAFGYMQSKERYVNAAEMIEVVQQYRQRNIPLDVIVLDWKSWPNGAGWGQKSFDPLRFAELAVFIEKLHSMGVKLMVSIWPPMTGGCENQRELLECGLMLGNQSTYNAFLPDARALYWEQAQRGLFAHGVDAWWCDCTEPFEADWSGPTKPEPHIRIAINTNESKLYLDAGEINAYSLLHSRGIYEGQRSQTTNKRVVNLTRSSYAGQHRYGTITWNGDVCATWETLRRSISEGVNFCATGEPYWTVDIGGFFVGNNPELWFWRGDYPSGCRGLTPMDALEPDPADAGSSDLGYWELYTRWLQYAVFLPMFRSHGTDVPREVWRFGEEGSPFYDAIVRSIRLRYELLLYIYSLASAVTFQGSPMVRAVALEFPEDRATYHLTDEYLFGPSLLVCPVTRPMYYERNSQPISMSARPRDVYLPATADWYCFRTGSFFTGGQTIAADAPLNSIPVFVRSGSIIPMTIAMLFADAIPGAPWNLHVYSGADAEFTLYEDSGDGYDYEHGAYARVRIIWNEKKGELTIAAREGTFPSLVTEREVCATFYSSTGRQVHAFRYTGQPHRIKINFDEDLLRNP